MATKDQQAGTQLMKAGCLITLIPILIVVFLCFVGALYVVLTTDTSSRGASTQHLAIAATGVVDRVSEASAALATSTPDQTVGNAVTPLLTPTQTPIPTQTSIPTPTLMPTPVLPPGSTVRIDDWDITVNHIDIASELEASFSDREEKAAGRFAILYMSVTNRGLSPDTFVAWGCFYVRDRFGRNYEENTVATFLVQSAHDIDLGVDINPDETRQLVAVYDIPRGKTDYYMVPGPVAESASGIVKLDVQ